MYEKAAEIALAAGRELMRLRTSSAGKGQWHGTQLKTEADAQLHHFLVGKLREHFPGTAVLSEEDLPSLASTRPARYWLIDPIDGTASFSAGYAGFVTQFALMEDERPRLSVIHAPAMRLLYSAIEGKGATLNGAALVVQPVAGRRILIDNYPRPRGCAQVIHTALRCTGYVESGSIGLKICRVADGTADIFVKDVTVRDWDVAPGHLVLQEAGGALLCTDGNEYPYHGVFEKDGLVAAHSRDLVQAATAALNKARST